MPFPKRDDKAKRPMPGIKFDKETIITLIRKHRGNISRVADAMGTTRYAIRERCKADPDLTKELEDARERLIDNLEDSVWERAEHSNDTTLQLFILKTQGRHRGWEQNEAQHMAKDIATAAFDFILDKSKNPASPPPAPTMHPQGIVSTDTET